MNKVLYHLCQHDVSIMDGWVPFPSTALSQVCGMTLYQTRKELKKLKEQGLVTSDMQIIHDDEGTTILRGYIITKKGMQTEEYKKAYNEERELCKKCFEIDIGEFAICDSPFEIEERDK